MSTIYLFTQTNVFDNLLVLYSFLQISVSPRDCFLLPEERLLIFIYCNFLDRKFTHFYFSENVFISLSFKHYALISYRQFGLYYFFQHIKDVTSLSSGSHVSVMEKAVSPTLFLSNLMHLLTQDASKIFSLSYIFIYLTLMCLSLLLVFILLWFTEFLYMWIDVFYQFVNVLGDYLFKYCISPILPFPYPTLTAITCV